MLCILRSKSNPFNETFFLCSCLFLLSGCVARDGRNPADGYFKEIGWRIKFPKDIVFQNTRQIDSLQNAAKPKIYKSPEKMQVYYTTLFSIIDGMNGFNATIENYDKRWEDYHKDDRAFLLDAIESQKQNIVLKDRHFKILRDSKFDK